MKKDKGAIMKKRVRGVLCFFIVLSAGSAFAISDPMWIFADKPNVPYSNFRYCDTARSDDVLCFALEFDQLPDSGVSRTINRIGSEKVSERFFSSGGKNA